MKCPECGRESKTSETRPARDGAIRRRRYCDDGHKFTTLELYADSMPFMEQMKDANTSALLAAAEVFAKEMQKLVAQYQPENGGLLQRRMTRLFTSKAAK